MKKTIAVLMIMLLLILNVVPAYASPVECEEIIGDIWLVENGVARKISYDEYLDLMIPVIDNSHETISLGARYTTLYDFERTSQYTYYDTARCVSPAVAAPGTAYAAYSVAVYSSYSRTVSATVKNLIKGHLTLNVTITDTAASLTGAAAGASYPPDPDAGKYCRVYFQPKMAKIAGTVTETYVNDFNGSRTETYDVTAYYPVSLGSNVADGIFFARYSNDPG